jgi:hypothetical protein
MACGRRRWLPSSSGGRCPAALDRVQNRNGNGLLIDQILAWDNALFRKELGALPEALQTDVRAALRDFLDL